MKKKRIIMIFINILVVFYLVVSSNFISAEENATKKQCVSKVKEAVEMIKRKGLHATKQVINDKNGPFVWKDSYLFMLDDVGILLAHPTRHDAISYSVRNVTDSNGKKFFLEMVELAKTKGEGWVDYNWQKQGDTEPTLRTVFIYKVPDEYVILGAGMWIYE